MSNDPTRTQKRDQQTNFMLTKEEKERFDAWRNHRGMSQSAACRYFVLKGLALEDQGE